MLNQPGTWARGESRARFSGGTTQKRSGRWRRALAAGSLLLGLAAQASAQTHVSGMGLDWGAWRFKPIYSETQGAIHVESFLALAKSDAVVGDNIVAVWYIRDTSATGGWAAKSWLTTSVKEAVWSVKQVTGIPDTEDPNWELDEPLGVLPSTIEPPKDYDKGVLTLDPLYPVISMSPDPAPLVELLATIGYKVASVSLEQSATCTPIGQLVELAGAFEWGIAQVVTDDASAVAQAEGTLEFLTTIGSCGETTPSAPCTPGLAGAWVEARAVMGNCIWSHTGGTVSVVMGGKKRVCNYVAPKYFSQRRVGKWRK